MWRQTIPYTENGVKKRKKKKKPMKKKTRK